MRQEASGLDSGKIVGYFKSTTGPNRGYVYGLIQEFDGSLDSLDLEVLGNQQVAFDTYCRIPGFYGMDLDPQGPLEWAVASDVCLKPKMYLTMRDLCKGITSVEEAASRIFGPSTPIKESEAGPWSVEASIAWEELLNKSAAAKLTIMAPNEFDYLVGAVLIHTESASDQETLKTFLDAFYPQHLDEFPRPLRLLKGLPKKRTSTDAGLALLRSMDSLGEAYFDYLVADLGDWWMECWQKKRLVLSLRCPCTEAAKLGSHNETLIQYDEASRVHECSGDIQSSAELENLFSSVLPNAIESQPTLAELESRFYPEHRYEEIAKMDLSILEKQAMDDSDRRLLLSSCLRRMDFFEKAAHFLESRKLKLAFESVDEILTPIPA